MADHGFYGADGTMSSGSVSGMTHNLSKCFKFDLVAHPGACPMRLKQFDGFRVNICIAVCMLQRTDLSLDSGCVDALRFSVTGSAQAFYDCVNSVMILFCIFKTFKDEKPDAFTKNGAVRVF